MEKITLTDIEKYTGGIRNGSALITSVSIDSRKIPDECLFIGVKGENFDGNDFVLNAIENRAMAVLTDRDIINAPSIKVSDTNKALKDLSFGYRKKFTDLKSVAVTGSVGKTTTKEMIYCILSQMGKTLKNEGNLNNQIGVPLTIFNLKKNHEYAVFEMGMNRRGEIKPLSDIVMPDVSVITNVSISHIEYLGSRENIALEKLDILSGTKSTIVLNGDEPLLRDVKTDKDVIYFGITGEDLDIKARDITVTAEQTSFIAVIYGKKLPITINAIGKHNVLNALAAIAACLQLGASEDHIIKGLSNFKNVGMRQNIYIYNGFKFIEDCYNASSPDSMKAAFDMLSCMKEEEKHIVLGQMAELGEYEDRAHIEVLTNALKVTDNVYIYGRSWKKVDIKNARYFETKEELGAYLKSTMNKGCVTLVKGSRSTKMEDVIKIIKE